MKTQQYTSYNVIKHALSYEQVIKKSRFIVDIAVTPDLASAKTFISDIKLKYPNAGHHCWAHVAGEPNGSHVFGFSDDSEPNGTAGKPMLNVLLGSGLGDVTAVVTRYFGGIKLGTGGLVRAYGGSLNEAMKLVEIVEKVPELIMIGASDYNHQLIIEQVLNANIIMDITKQYDDKVAWRVKMDARSIDQVIETIKNKTSGQVIFNIED